MSLQSLLDNATNLPVIPKVVQALIVSFGETDVDIDQVSRTLASDQVLTAKVLRLANSARYGGQRKIGSVQEAVVVLGFNALRTLVLASGLTGAFKAPENFDLRQFWRNSFAVAALCKWLARPARLDPELAFTCGMMHNLGALLIHLLAPDQAARLEASGERDEDLSELQQQALGYDFTEAGAALAERWQFPQAIADAIRYQLCPLQQPAPAPYASLLYLANFILIYNSSHHQQAMLAEFPVPQARALGLDAQALIERLPETQGLDSDIEELLP